MIPEYATLYILSFLPGVLGTHGSDEKDQGAQVARKAQSTKMVRNEKGLWVKVSVSDEGSGSSSSYQDFDKSRFPSAAAGSSLSYVNIYVLRRCCCVL